MPPFCLFTFSHGCFFLSLSLEPAAFSVKTIPQTRSPEVTKPHFPPMSLTLQVTFRLRSQSHTHILFVFIPRCLFFSILFVYLCMHHFIWLPHIFLSVSFSLIYFQLSFSLFLTHTHKRSHNTSVLMMVWTSHAVMMKGDVCIFLYALCYLDIFTCVVLSLEPNNLFCSLICCLKVVSPLDIITQ